MPVIIKGVTRICTVCTHDAAESIDAGLTAGQPLRALAIEYGVSRAALDRHARHHLWPETTAVADAAPASDADKGRTPALVDASRKRSLVARMPPWFWGFLVGYAVGQLRR
jgi:hypothetical protein